VGVGEGGVGVGVGVGVGGGGVGLPSPTYSKALVSPLFKSEIAFRIALPSNSDKTALDDLLGLACNTRAAPPETWGHAIDVPLNVRVPESDVCDSDLTSLPGAQMSVHLP